MTTTATFRQSAVDQIAASHLGCDTLETQHSDSVDFRDLAVWNIKAALEAAFNAGAAAQRIAERHARAAA